MLQKIVHQDSIIALIIRNNFFKDGLEFFTPKEFSQQVAYMNRPKGYAIEPHMHSLFVRQVFIPKKCFL
jgi:hypothetical protein